MSSAFIQHEFRIWVMDSICVSLSKDSHTFPRPKKNLGAKDNAFFQMSISGERSTLAGEMSGTSKTKYESGMICISGRLLQTHRQSKSTKWKSWWFVLYERQKKIGKGNDY
jgi:hypothetical protein